MAEGGTGYISDGSSRGPPGHTSSPYGSERHLAAIKDAPLDALLVNGSANDRKKWTPDQHRVALETFLNDVERVRPGLPVVIVGIEPVSFTREASVAPHYGQLTSNFAGMIGRHANLVGVIDSYNQGWLTGTGSSADPKGDGNQDQYIGPDGAHLNGDGQMYYQGKIATALRSLPLPQAP
jgi:hypothetical protein